MIFSSFILIEYQYFTMTLCMNYVFISQPLYIWELIHSFFIPQISKILNNKHFFLYPFLHFSTPCWIFIFNLQLHCLFQTKTWPTRSSVFKWYHSTSTKLSNIDVCHFSVSIWKVYFKIKRQSAIFLHEN